MGMVRAYDSISPEGLYCSAFNKRYDDFRFAVDKLLTFTELPEEIANLGLEFVINESMFARAGEFKTGPIEAMLSFVYGGLALKRQPWYRKACRILGANPDEI